MQKAKRRLKKRISIDARIKYHMHPKKWATGGSLSIHGGHVTPTVFAPLALRVEPLHPMWTEYDPENWEVA